MSRFTPLRIALGLLGMFAAGFVALGLVGWGTPAANEQPIGEISRWCERVAAGLLREPVNTLGNLGFVVAGMAMFATLARDEATRPLRRNAFTGNRPLAVLYASAVLFLGPGSMAMHASHTRAGAWIDNVSMVAFILIPWLVNLAQMGRWSDRVLFTTYGVLLGGYAAGYWFIGPELGVGLDLFGISIGLWAISEVLHRWHSPALRPLSGLVGFGVAAVFGLTPAVMLSDPGGHWWVVLFWIPGSLARHPPPTRRRYVPWFWAGVASFAVAYAIWLTGKADHPWCAPDSLLQAHAVWHVLSAAATWAFFLFLRTEAPLAGAGLASGATAAAGHEPRSG